MSQPLNYAYPATSKPPRRAGWRIFLTIVFVVGGIFVLLMLSLKQAAPIHPAIAVSDFYAQVKRDNVSSITIDGDSIDGQLRTTMVIDNRKVTQFHTELPAGTSGNWTFTQWLLETSPTTVVRTYPSNNILTNFLLPFIPWLLIMAFVWFCISRVTRRNRSRPLPVFIVQPETR
jgi:ATP-dependent Zn protease